MDTRYQDPFREYLNKDMGATDEVVSQIGAVANIHSGILDNFVIEPMKYSVGMVARLFDVTGIFGKNLQRWAYE